MVLSRDTSISLDVPYLQSITSVSRGQGTKAGKLPASIVTGGLGMARAKLMDMVRATHASLVLARFDELTLNPGGQHSGDHLFRRTGADVRASGMPFADQSAFKFVLYGLHTSESAARSALEDYLDHAPWFSGAKEIWGAALVPIRHYGEANFLDRESPGAVFDNVPTESSSGGPLVVVTSVGWQLEGLDEARVRQFSEGVTSVRISMTAVPGLHSQQTFSFPGGLETDGITVTFWRDFADMREFAYGPGVHRDMLTRQRAEHLGDRTSFTRFRVLSSFGTWHGSDPLAWG